ncbi:MAG: hypothetical protein ACRD82_10570, partial [Blastocatellia bacterium]
SLTIELKPELEIRLRDAANKAGLDAKTFITLSLEERLRESDSKNGKLPPRLSKRESGLIKKINEGLPEEIWKQYRQLAAKRRAETLTRKEHTELIALSDKIEELGSRRMEALVQLSALRQIPLKTLMKQMGIQAPRYE